MQKLILLAGLLAVSAHLGAAENRLVCVYQETSDQVVQKPFDIVTDTDAHLCTHLIFSSVEPTPVFTVNLAGLSQQVQDFNNLKTSNPNLLTFLEVNLTMAGSPIFQDVNRPTLITSIMAIMTAENFDGVNVLWVYGTNNLPGDKQKFTLLMQELREQLDLEFTPQDKLLTASVSGVIADIENSYDISNLIRIVDFFNVMTFEVDPGYPPQFPNAKDAMDYFVTEGAPAGQLNMGIATYGFGAPTGSIVQIPDVLAKYEVCQNNPPGSQMDSDATIIAKCGHIQTGGFGGAYVKSLDLDDFNGNDCSQGNYPVIQLIKNSLA